MEVKNRVDYVRDGFRLLWDVKIASMLRILWILGREPNRADLGRNTNSETWENET